MTKRHFLPILVLGLASGLLCACHTDEPVQEDDAPVPTNIVVPATFECDPGSIFYVGLRGDAKLKQSDKILLRDERGNESTYNLIDLSKDSFSFRLNPDLGDGTYSLFIFRDGVRYYCGAFTLTINTVSPFVVEPEEGSTVYGMVSCNGEGVPDVVVSDGYEVVRTNGDGIYQMRSEKHHKYVFISIPSGYEVPTNGILPTLHKQLTMGATVPERVDFTLLPAGDQTDHIMLIFGDIHLANRTGDRAQFAEFVKDVNSTLATNAGKKIYALTLGDMTWDLYWKDNKYSYPEYLKDANGIQNLTVYHTIGNHDHSMYYAGDFDTVVEYKKTLAPTYYSFNVGKVHYVVLDNIECTNSTINTGRSDGAYNRTYKDNLVQEQLNWLKKDLAYIPTSTPLCLTMHAPLFTAQGALSLDDGSDLVTILKAYDQVQFFTGHTHKMYNIDNSGSTHVFEHNAGAVCATWWWSANQTPGIHVAQDGAPGGYSIVNVKGTEFNWRFKGTGRDLNHQFRTYDRNTIALTTATYTPAANTSSAADFAKYAADWSSASTDNYVYINVWNYDEKWKITVTENGKELTVSRMSAMKDPLHLVAYTAQRANKNATISFPTSDTRHIFRVKASSPNSTLLITVTDRFGNVYQETMTRPKVFSTNIYK